MGKTRIREQVGQIGAKAWTVSQVWECPSSESTQHRKDLWAQVPSGSTPGILASRHYPRAITVDILDDRGAEGFDWIVAKYRTLTVEEYMDRYAGEEGIGHLVGGLGLRGEQIRKCTIPGGECNGAIIQGEDTSVRNRKWIIERGPRVRMVPQARYTVRVYTRDHYVHIGQWEQALAVGKVNTAGMSNIADSRGKELLMSRLAYEPHPYEGRGGYAEGRWIVEYDFMTTGTRFTWNDINQTRAFKRVVVHEPVLDMETGDPTGDTRVVWQLIPDETVQVENHDLYETINMSPINNVLSASRWG